MEIELQRDEWGQHDTPGTVTVDGLYECRSLEDRVREVAGREVFYWKVKGATAIPAGRRRLVLEDSPRFGPDTMTIPDVPGFEAIRIHGGNDEDDTEGCPLLGLRLEREADDGSWRIAGGTSRPAVQALKAKVRAALEAGEEVWITVKNPPAWHAANQPADQA